MRSSHNVHLSNQKMKYSTRVALYKDVKCFWKGVDVEEIYVKKCKIFGFWVITSWLTCWSSYLKKVKDSSWPDLRIEISQLKIWSLISEILRKIWKHEFGSRSRTVIRINTETRTAVCRIRVHIWVEFGGWMWCGFGDLRRQSRVRKKKE